MWCVLMAWMAVASPNPWEAQADRVAGDAVGDAAAELARALASHDADPEVRWAAASLLERLTAIDPDGVQADHRAVATRADEWIARGRRALRAGDYATALAALRPLRDTPAWVDAQPFWLEAVDGHVRVERERAGALYREAKAMPRARRADALREVRRTLATLIAEHPDAALAEDVARNLNRVERELELMD